MVVNVSKTFEFNPNLGELITHAFGRIGVRPTELTASHLYQGRISANMVLVEFSNKQPLLWEVDLIEVPLLQGSATYSVAAETVMILDAIISTGSPTETDRVISPVSRTEYMSYPKKEDQGFPTVFWFDRLISPTITLWPVPDGSGPYVLKYYSVRQTMDAVLSNGLTVEIPYRFLDAYVAHLAWKLAEIYSPQLEQRMEQKAERAWNIAATQDTENVPMYIIPGLSGYWS